MLQKYQRFSTFDDPRARELCGFDHAKLFTYGNSAKPSWAAFVDRQDRHSDLGKLFPHSVQQTHIYMLKMTYLSLLCAAQLLGMKLKFNLFSDSGELDGTRAVYSQEFQLTWLKICSSKHEVTVVKSWHVKSSAHGVGTFSTFCSSSLSPVSPVLACSSTGSKTSIPFVKTVA